MMAQPAMDRLKPTHARTSKPTPAPIIPIGCPKPNTFFPLVSPEAAGSAGVGAAGGNSRRARSPRSPAAHTVLFAHAALARKHGHRERDETAAAAAMRQRRNGGEGAATAERCKREPCFLAPLVLPRRTDHAQLPPSPAGTTTAPAVLHRVFESFFTAARR